MNKKHILVTVIALFVLSACSQPKQDNTPVDQLNDSNDVTRLNEPTIMYNQLGYLPDSVKHIMVNTQKSLAYVLTDSNGQNIKKGQSSEPTYWSFSGQHLSYINLTDVEAVGRYQLSVYLNHPSDSDPEVISTEITIQPNIYAQALKKTAKAFYFNRASTELLPQHAGVYARPAAHLDDKVFIHKSAASQARPTGTIVSSPKGWYDAGDYNKYGVNGSVALYTMLMAYHDFPVTHKLELNIPESTNTTADFLDEIYWQLDWLLTMQDPNDGGVYHKLSTLRFSKALMPHEANKTRYMVAKSLGATLDFSATLAYAAIALKQVDADKALAYQNAAEYAWQWALNHPDARYVQPEEMNTGMYIYDSEDFKDEWFWAATELAILTNKTEYWQEVETYSTAQMVIPSWDYVAPFAWIRLAEQNINTAWQSRALTEVTTTADKLVQQYKTSGLKTSMGTYVNQTMPINNDFVWGSNGVASNHVLVLSKAHQLNNNPEYKNAMQGTLDYLFGKNPTGYSYVTGLGKKTPLFIHHRQSEADDISAPIPGLLAGGPHSGQQDECKGYPSKLPALSYTDEWCSYATNEVAINWNAPLVYVLSAFN